MCYVYSSLKNVCLWGGFSWTVLVKASACGRVGSANEIIESYTVFVMADIAEQLHV